MQFDTILDSKWATFFDNLSIKFLYKEISMASKLFNVYPTFYLPEVHLRNDLNTGVYLIINEKSNDYLHGKKFPYNLVEFVGEPKYNLFAGLNQPNGTQIIPFYDYPMGFWYCDYCETAKIEFYEGNYNNCPKCGQVNQNNLSQQLYNALQ